MRLCAAGCGPTGFLEAQSRDNNDNDNNNNNDNNNRHNNNKKKNNELPHLTSMSKLCGEVTAALRATLKHRDKSTSRLEAFGFRALCEPVVETCDPRRGTNAVQSQKRRIVRWKPAMFEEPASGAAGVRGTDLRLARTGNAIPKFQGE